MGSEEKKEVLKSISSFLTGQEKGNEDINTDLPTGDNVKFIQFCRAMQVGFELDCYKTIANQTDAIMISNARKSREEAVTAMCGMDKQERESWRMGPQGRPASSDDKKGK